MSGFQRVLGSGQRRLLSVKGAGACFLGLAALLCLQFVSVAQAGVTQPLPGHLPAAIIHLTPLGRLEQDRELRLAIGLPLRNKEGLTNLLQRIYDPASPDYHRYLTPAQFAESFGPTREDYQAVTSFAIANGLKVSATHPNRTLLDVTGSVSNIEKALHVTFRTYAHSRENRVFYAPDVEPSIDLATPVLHISGLDNYYQPHPMILTNTLLDGLAGLVLASGSGPSGTYMGNDFRAAYAPGVALTGAGQKVGLLEFDGYYTNDISNYASMAGIAAVPLTNVYLDGFSGNPGAANTEVALDIEMANCMAPGLSLVIVYEGELPNDILNRMATDALANQLSSSWSYRINPATEQIFQQFAAQGQSFFNSSGDSDAWVGEIPTPCDDPNVTSVGGTTLTTSGPEGIWLSETVWNWDVEYGPKYNGLGTGGGISATYPIPSWQLNVNMASNQGSTIFRNIPDVALTADNVLVVADDGLSFNVGGTSCAAPLWAGFIALANEQASSNGQPALGFINPAIYALGLGPDYASCFHDIIVGNNTWSESQSQFYAAPGYDLCSGWGTPMGSNLVNLLAPLDPLQISPLGGWISVGTVGGPFSPESQEFTLTNSWSDSLSFHWTAGLTVPWLSLSLNGGTLAPGGPAATVVVSLTAAAGNLPPGGYPATIWFTNLTDGVVQSRAFSLRIITPPVIASQPASLTTIEGTTATFTAGAQGGWPLYCQWQYNGTNVTNAGRVSVSQTPGNPISVNALAVSTLTISGVTSTDAGNYVMTASNAAGVVVSSNAVLTVLSSKPVISQQPASQTVLVGATAQFTVVVDGTPPFTYQWQQNGTNLVDGSAASGSATPILTLYNASSATIGTYTVLLSNTLGSAVSAAAVLRVQVAVPGEQLAQNGGFETGNFSFWDEAGNFSNCSVSTNAFAVYSGNYGAQFGPSNSLGYISQTLPTVAGQIYVVSFWLDSPDGLAPNEFLAEWDGSAMFAQTNLEAIGWTHLQFYVSATGTNTVLEFGFRDDQSFLGLDNVEVIPLASADGPPIIAIQPASQAAGQGGAASLSVLSSGRLPLSYQWQFDGTNLDDATNATLTLFDLSSNQTGIYNVLVNNALGSTASSNALLTVLTGSSNLITFDELPQSEMAVENGYHSLTWSNFYYLDVLGDNQPSNGYAAGLVSLPKVAFNGNGQPAVISAPTTFSLLSAYLTAAWNDQLQLEVQGYNGPSLIYDNFYNLSATTPTLIEFNYVGVTSVQFISSDGIPHPGYQGNGTQFAMDNVTVISADLPSAVLPSVATLYSFVGFDGGSPSAALLPAPDGNFYGTTEYGGANGYGTVFKMTTNGGLATLVSLTFSNGAYPAATLALGTDGNFYGTTQYGGTNDNGTVFKVTTNGVLTTLASFDYDETGGYPSASLLQGADGNFYGTTSEGGSYNCGTVFKMTTNGTLTTLVYFDSTNGANPQAGLTQGDNGNIYGTTERGGPQGNQGTVFGITTNGTLTTLAIFNYLVGGLPLSGLLQAADGNFYGTTLIGGAYDYGTVFKMSPSGAIATLASFDYTVTGASPSAPLAQGADGCLYGTTPAGGIFGSGTIFKITTNGTLTSLYSFQGETGLSTSAGLVQGPDGNFYGTAPYGGLGFNGDADSGDGVVFRLGAAPAVAPPAIISQPVSQTSPVSGAAIFNVFASGSAPLNYAWQSNGVPIAGATQSCYTVQGVGLQDSGSQFSCVICNTYGSVVSANATLNAFSTSGPLCSFNGEPGGGWSFSALVQGADGNFYGTTEYGGTNGDGTVFKVTTNGTLSTLGSFSYFLTGSNPWSGMALGPDGNFYGTTTYGGAHELGTVYRMTTNGSLTTLLSFDSLNGANPYDALTLGADGNFYGTTFSGGKYDQGTVFSMTTNGDLSTLASIAGYPFAGLVQGPDGNLYGATIAGGTNDDGSIFRIATNGTFTTLFSFNGTNGSYPYATPTFGTDGNLYGATYYGGSYGQGEVYRITTNGALAILFTFNGTNGQNPLGSLALGTDGNFYGTTAKGGTNGVGMVFSITSNGVLTTLFSFQGANGSFPGAALVQGNDGSFYGTTGYGGASYDGLFSSGNGTVFRLEGAFTKAPLIVAQPVSQLAVVGDNVTLSISASGAGPLTYQWQFDGVNYLNPVTSGIITTVAGNGTLGFSGDGGAATNASLGDSHGVAVDGHGNLFIADTENGRIREVGTNGIITTVAGNGTPGYSGDGGAATNASLDNPYGVAVDAYGNLFIADTGNGRIREVGLNGIITTVAGNGTPGFSGDGGAATNAGLDNPYSVAVDAYGNLFIADTGNGRIREVGTNGIIATVVGNGTFGYSGDGGAATNASLDNPYGVAVDAQGNLFIADTGNGRIREVGTNGIITTVAGNGTPYYSGDGGGATNASLDNPWSVAVDAFGDVFISDSGNNRVREVDSNGSIVTVAGNGANGYYGDGGLATEAELNDPAVIAVDASGNVFIADSGNNRIREAVLQGPSIVLTDVADGASGAYDVVVSNAYGSITSSVAILTVGVSPTITSQPANLTLTYGATATFSATDEGSSPLFYQWQFNGVDLSDNSQITGSQSSVLTLTDVTVAETGTYQIVVSNAFGSASAFAMMDVNMAVPVLIWTTPAPITYGAAIGSNQLDATATVPGNLAYIPTNGMVLDAGTNTLSVLFTPEDAEDYSTVSDNVSMMVLSAPLTVTASNASRTFGQINPVFTGTMTGVTNGDNITASYSCSATSNSPVGTYPIVPSLVDPNDRQSNYTVTFVNGALAITMAVPVLTFTNPAPLTYGAPLTSNQLDAVANVLGSFAYLPTNGTVLDVGTNTISVIFTPSDTVDYSIVSESVSIVVSPTPLTVTAASVTQPFGSSIPVFTGTMTGLTNGDDITVAYSCSATNNSPVGTYPIVPSLVDPDDRQTNYTVTLVNGTLIITGSPVLEWNPAPITYGAAIGSNQLNATTSVPGSFTYLPTNGTVPDAGTNTISVIFTPADTTDFSTVSDSVGLVVSPAPLTVTASNFSQPYGSSIPVFTGTMTGVTNGDNITATYSCSATSNSPPGTYPIVASLADPDDRQTNYMVTLINGTLTITVAVPALTWTNPAPFTYGAPLTSNQLNAVTSVPGNFTYLPTNGTVLDAGTNMILVIFTPGDSVDYSMVSESVSMVVLPASLTVTASNASRSFGQLAPVVFTGSITGVTNGDDITATYSCSATDTSPVGIYPIVPSLVDPDDRRTNYTVTLVNGTLTIRGTPILAWTPEPVTYGTPLGSNQLNATTSVPGNFTYTPTNGTILDAGTYTISVIFTPADTADFGTASESVSLVVLPAPLTVTASNISQPYGSNIPVFTGTMTGVTNADNITANYNCSATNNSPPGYYPIVPSLVDPDDRLTNYTVTLINGTLTITMAVPALTWTNPAPFTYGAPLTSNQLNAVANLPGSFTYIPTNGTILDAGTNSISVIFTPVNTVDYSMASESVCMVVLAAPLTVTASNASRFFGQTNPVFMGTLTGVTNGDDITVIYICNATNNSPAEIYPIVPSLVDPDDRQTNYTVTLVNGTLTVIALPQVQSVQQSGSTFNFTWSAIPNQMYQIQSATNLTQPVWTNVGSVVTASNSSMTASESIATNLQQFYRILLWP